MISRRTLLRLVLASAVALVVLALASIAAVATFGISVDAGPWRHRIERALGDATGRRITLNGPIQLAISLRPSVAADDVRVANPPGFTGQDFAVLRHVTAQLDLASALRGRFHLISAEATNTRIRAETTLDGRDNWQFGAPRSEVENAAVEGRGRDDARAEVSVEMDRLLLRDVSLEYRDLASQRVRYFDLDELSGEARRDRPVKLSLRGRIDQAFPYTVTVEGGPMRALWSGAQPWPFVLDLAFAGTHLHASGAFVTGSGEARFDFGLGSEDFAEIERFLQTKLPKVGVAGLSGRVTARSGAVEITDLRGVMGVSVLDGRLRIDTRAAQPRLSGELSLPTLDVRPFLKLERAPAEKPLSYDELANSHIDMRGLAAFDADLALHIGRWLGLPGDISDARVRLNIANGNLRAPFEATIADVPFAGEIALDSTAPAPVCTLTLATQRSGIGRLAQLLTGLPGIDGTLGRFDFELRGQGETLGAVIRSVEARSSLAGAALSYGNIQGDRPVKLTLDALNVSIPNAGVFRADARGALLGERLRLQLIGDDMPSMLRNLRSRIELAIQGPGTRLRVKGVLARPEARSGTDLAFSVDGKRARDLASWLGMSRVSRAPVKIHGRFRLEADDWHLYDLALNLGRSDLVIDAHRTEVSGRSIILASIRSALLDIPELQSVLQDDKPAARRTEIDIPVLPARVDLADADIGFGLERVMLARGEVTNAAFAARIRGGRMEPSALAGRYAGVPFAGTTALDLRGDVPELSVALSANDVDVGKLLHTLRLAEGVDTHVGALGVELMGRGSRLSELLKHSSFQARLTGGLLRLHGPARRLLGEIQLREAVAAARPGQPVSVRFEGTLDDHPVIAIITSGSLSDFGGVATHVPVSLDAEAAGVHVALDGRAALPIRQGAADLVLRISGERLDKLSRLARTELPAWGPWSIEGPVRIRQAAYDLPDLTVAVGGSRLSGGGRLDLGGERPRLDLSVTAPRLQLDDFPLVERSAPGPDAAEPMDLQARADELRAKAKETASQAQALGSAATLRRLNGQVDIQVDEVRSGAERLGSGHLRAQLEGGRLLLGPAELNIPGGTVRLALAYEPSDRDVAVALGAYAERFDYGILARRVKSGTEFGGLLSLKLELAARAPTLDALMAHADGRIELAVWPYNFKAGVFDLWAISVFAALIPVVDPSAESKVNCAVTRFNLRAGKLTHEAIVIDTSRMRVTGAGGADFRDETLSFRLRPRAKQKQLFSLATPVDVTGTFTDFHVGPRFEDVFLTAGRLASSLLLLPPLLFGDGPLPEDGRDVCTDPLRYKDRAGNSDHEPD